MPLKLRAPDSLRFLVVAAALAVLPLVTATPLAAASPAPQHPSPPAEPGVRPLLPLTADSDGNDNRIDDRLDSEIGEMRRALAAERLESRRAELAGRLAEHAPVELVFSSQVTQQQIDAFLALGGRIGRVYKAVSYGWSGSLPRDAVDALPAAMGDSLLLVVPDLPAQMHMDEASRTGRVRPVWQPGFANSTSGFSANGNITIGIVDSGVDDSHPDLAGRMELWEDFTTDNEPAPRDIVQHGSHVAGIALGTGQTFGAGPGTLHYTDSGTLAGYPGNTFVISMMHLPETALSFHQDATWLGGSTLMHFATRSNGVSGNFFASHTSPTQTSPILLDTDLTGNAAQTYSSALVQNQQKSISRWSVANTVTNYAGIGDGFNALRGVAPGARWAAAKVFANSGTGSSSTISAAMDEMIAQRIAHRIKVVNMSVGLIGNPGIDAVLRAKANTMASNGMVVVVSAGNDGAGTAAANQVDDPGRAAMVITVGSNNDVNQLTQYTSSGFASPTASEDMKPDVLAPGGSDYYSYILSVDTNDSDAEIATFADRVPNDYYNIKGTSMASPFVAGAAALVVDAMEQAGTTWAYTAAQSMFVKMLLCASATETNAPREVSTGTNPTLGRGAAPKDIFEGYGLINPDAAIEAISVPWDGTQIFDSTDGGRFDRRAWGRRVEVTSALPMIATLTVPVTADYDLYLYSDTPDAKGNPVIIDSSTTAGLGVSETVFFDPNASGEQYLVIKRVSGSGEWALESFPEVPVCGDNRKHPFEDCEDGNTAAGDCCSPTCTNESNGSPCNDGLFCTATDTCTSGVCGGTGDPCAAGSDCNNSCNETANNCATPNGTTCTSDSNACTLDRCNGSGACTHVAGNAGAVCRASSGICDAAETCTGASTNCPADVFSSTASICRPAASACDAAERCTGASAACPGDGFAATTVTCRAAAGSCDVAETCTGTGTGCPADNLAPTSFVCRGAASFCDAAETCTGTAPACPSDSFANASAVCRASAGACDVEEACTGTSPTCPANVFLPTTSVCRSSAGVCDAAETCTGSSATCPVEALRPSTAICRSPVGACDDAERCTGSTVTCPADAISSSTTTCRAAVSPCDVAERCDGATVVCPADDVADSGVLCRAVAGACDQAETCSGASASCPADAFVASTNVCRPSSGVCDAAESCTGASGACPADAMLPSSAVCRATTGVCDPAEKCSGSTKACGADVLLGPAAECRPRSGDCDVAESCTGSSGACPGDAVLASTAVCRGANGDCDAVERCDGVTKSCPANVLRPENDPCSTDGKACTNDVCDGTTNVCRHLPIEGACDDGLFCNGTDSCSGGLCSQHTGNPCPGADGDDDCSESCSEANGACDGTDQDASACDDGDECTGGDECSGGVCGGDPLEGCGATTTLGPPTTTLPVTTTTLASGLCGDANEDEDITAADALKALRGAVGTSDCGLVLCDFNGDGKVSATDALAILRLAVGQPVVGNCPVAAAAAGGASTTMPVTTTLPVSTTVPQ